MVPLPGFRVQHDDAGLKAVKGRVPFGHLYVTVLAQDDGAGGVLAVVVVVDQIGLFCEGVQPVLLAGLQKDLALGVGGLGADEVAHVGKADREMLAICGGDLHRHGRGSGLQGRALGGALLHSSHAGCGALDRGGSGCGRGGRRCAVASECHINYLLHYLTEPYRKPRSAAPCLNHAMSSGVNSTQKE